MAYWQKWRTARTQAKCPKCEAHARMPSAERSIEIIGCDRHCGDARVALLINVRSKSYSCTSLAAEMGTLKASKLTRAAEEKLSWYLTHRGVGGNRRVRYLSKRADARSSPKVRNRAVNEVILKNVWG